MRQRLLADRLYDWSDRMRARSHRWRWLRRLLLAVILVPWFGHFAYVRMTSLPADPNGTQARYSSMLSTLVLPADHPAQALLSAMPDPSKIPTVPAPTTAPAGMQWQMTNSLRGLVSRGGTLSLKTDDAREGDWTPDGRHCLRHIIAYLESPAVEEAVVRIREIVSKPVRLSVDSIAGETETIRSTAKLLLAHARCRIAQHHDVDTAILDLQAVFDLCDRFDRDGLLIHYLVAVGCRSLVLQETTCWSSEIALDRRDARRLVELLRSRRPDLRKQWTTTITREEELIRGMLESCYTQTADGNGWAVLHSAGTGSTDDRILSTLNLLSVTLNDRRTLTGKHEYAMNKGRAATDLPYEEAAYLLGPSTRRSRSQLEEINPADLPLPLSIAYNSYGTAYEQFVRASAAHSAAIVSLALGAYHTEHGRFPATLADLVPDYLDALPLDPISGQPLCYRLDERDGYALYCVGENGIDDGGRLRDEIGRFRRAINAPDWVFPPGRSEPTYEWFLVPAAQPANGSTNAQPQ